jgi:hypothetical protein
VFKFFKAGWINVGSYRFGRNYVIKLQGLGRVYYRGAQYKLTKCDSRYPVAITKRELEP